MKGMKRVFWIAFAVFAVCMTQVAAVLYAETPEMFDGGFLSFSPWLDVAVWGTPMVIAGIVMLCCNPRKHLSNRIPQTLGYPAAYVFTQLILTALVLVMGLCRILDKFSPIHLPIYGYAIFLCGAYLAAGFLWGRRCGGSIPGALVCFGALLAVMGMLAGTRLAEIAEDIAYWTPKHPPGSIFFRYTDGVMDTWQGQGLALLNLPGCVLMGNYAYAHSDIPGMGHEIPREVMTWLVTLVPVTLFTGAWFVGRKTKK